MPARPKKQISVVDNQTDSGKLSMRGKSSIEATSVSDYAVSTTTSTSTRITTTTGSKTKNPNPLHYVRINGQLDPLVAEEFPLLERARRDPGGYLVFFVNHIFDLVRDGSLYDQLRQMIPSGLRDGKLRKYLVKNTRAGQSKDKMLVIDDFLFRHLIPTFLVYIIQRRDYAGLLDFVTGISVDSENLVNPIDVAIRSQALFFLGLVFSGSHKTNSGTDRQDAFEWLLEAIPVDDDRKAARNCYNKASIFQQSLADRSPKTHIRYTEPILGCFSKYLINPKVFGTVSNGNLFIPVMDSYFKDVQLTQVDISWDTGTNSKTYI
ncbi:hypothetical protein BJ085DRAFT_29996 [Dimargaris cristalligena]|uniref:Uncharacterized protein n=1 Tax=Dimargaris cristalligena TaxID=215637 RepID=A0A4Q0A2K5_9FUNG|nr:hypothetical protein BJ085DRAFT_29996 [Dimargaris cristalligena]|eukprot:RKP40345.1 hypothetical protein BJ085DRAFT_29996 [Dimargaris cristalligena]